AWGGQDPPSVDGGVLMINARWKRYDNKKFASRQSVAPQIRPIHPGICSSGFSFMTVQEDQATFPFGLQKLGKGWNTNSSQ
ncbi:MAG: hypothetical protein OEZ41_11295, partial [Nitrospirota bacterium]|nr:hypothetical protein [Nitrospirota bacterium]